MPVIRAVPVQVLRLRLKHVEVRTQLHGRRFMVVRRMLIDCQRQSVPVDNLRDYHVLTTPGRADLLATALGRK